MWSNKYCVLDLDVIGSRDFNEALDEMEELLQLDSYDYFLANDPYAGQLVLLVVPEKYINGTSTQLDELLESCGLTYSTR